MFIMDKMLETLPQPRDELSPYAPRIQSIKINPEKIGAVIGPGGKTIRRIQDEAGAKIDIDDDGTVHISADTEEGMQRALERGARAHRGGRDRQDLHRRRPPPGGLRRLRRDPAGQGRPGAHLAARRLPRQPAGGCRLDGRRDHGDGDRGRPAGAHQPLAPRRAERRDADARRNWRRSVARVAAVVPVAIPAVAATRTVAPAATVVAPRAVVATAARAAIRVDATATAEATATTSHPIVARETGRPVLVAGLFLARNKPAT